MLNFRKIKQEFSTHLLQKGQQAVDSSLLSNVKFDLISKEYIKASCNFNTDAVDIQTNIEFKNDDSSISDSHCSCGSKSDCQHIVALSIYIEKNFNNLISDQVNNKDSKTTSNTSQELLDDIKSKIKQSSYNQNVNNTINEYSKAYELLKNSPLFSPTDKKERLAKLYMHFKLFGNANECAIAKFYLKIHGKKPIAITDISSFQQNCRKCMQIELQGSKLHLVSSSFEEPSKIIFDFIKNNTRARLKNKAICEIDSSSLGDLINLLIPYSTEYESESGEINKTINEISIVDNENALPLIISNDKALIHCNISQIHIPESKILIHAQIQTKSLSLPLEKCNIIKSEYPFFIIDNEIYRFNKSVTTNHIASLNSLKETAIPEPLFGTFFERSISFMKNVVNEIDINNLFNIKTLPLEEQPKAICSLEYYRDTLEAVLSFKYGNHIIPYGTNNLTIDKINSFKTKYGILERDILYEESLAQNMFVNFYYNENKCIYQCKNDKHIVHFMTSILPSLKHKLYFETPQSLSNKFIYDNPSINIDVKISNICHSEAIIDISFGGSLIGISINKILSAISSGEFFIEKISSGSNSELSKSMFLVFPEKNTQEIIDIMLFLGIDEIKNQTIKTNMWKVSNLLQIEKRLYKHEQQNLNLQNTENEDTEDTKEYKHININISDDIKTIYNEILLSQKEDIELSTPQLIYENVKLRHYQNTGVSWLSKLSKYNMNALIADDMGLGKTIQIIVTIANYIHANPNSLSIIFCPSSLIYNWFYEFKKFSSITVENVVGSPLNRKEKIESARQNKVNVIIVSYASSQKDISILENIDFDYLVIDEAQYIKNKNTITHKVVKKINAKHKIAATGTPIENFLTELYNILDLLMPGILGESTVFKKTYIKNSDTDFVDYSELKKIIEPFIIRRIKKDVLDELPELSEIDIRCDLTTIQKKLYKTYAKHACQEIDGIIEKSGIKNAKMHIFSCITKLKQICCHPGILDSKYLHDPDCSEKYSLLKTIIETLIKSSRRVVVFSQYISMLSIIKTDLIQSDEKFCYIDGNTVDKLFEVEKFNEQKEIKIFLISLKAGGVGLNITGADTIIHFDLSWNPSIEEQATSRVYRMGQKNHVLVYRIIAKSTIEEKILDRQQKKKGLASGVVDYNSSATNISWEEMKAIISEDIL